MKKAEGQGGTGRVRKVLMGSGQEAVIRFEDHLFGERVPSVIEPVKVGTITAIERGTRIK